MEPKFNSSFIPKNPIVAQKRSSTRIKGVRRGADTFTLIAVAVFLVAVVLSSGVFVYKISLEKKISEQEDSLESATQNIDYNFIQEALALSDRLFATKTILEEHLSPKSLFDLLEESTMQNVSFDTFIFEDGEDGTTISATGVAESFDSMALQSDKLWETGYMKDVIFSEFVVNDDDTIDFTLNATISPKDLVIYSNSLIIEEIMLEDTDIDETSLEGDLIDDIDSIDEELEAIDDELDEELDNI